MTCVELVVFINVKFVLSVFTIIMRGSFLNPEGRNSIVIFLKDIKLGSLYISNVIFSSPFILNLKI